MLETVRRGKDPNKFLILFEDTAAIAGLLLAMGGLALWLSRSLMNVNTDVTPTSSDLRGALGKVITRIPEGGLGEVRVSRHGHPLKLSARAEEAIDPGVEIVVVDVLSPTSVLVIRSEIEIG